MQLLLNVQKQLKLSKELQSLKYFQAVAVVECKWVVVEQAVQYYDRLTHSGQLLEA